MEKGGWKRGVEKGGWKRGVEKGVEKGGGKGGWKRGVEKGGGKGGWKRGVEKGGGKGGWKRGVEKGGGKGRWNDLNVRGDLLEMRVVHTYSVLLGVSDLLLFFATGKFRVQSPAFVDALRRKHPKLCLQLPLKGGRMGRRRLRVLSTSAPRTHRSHQFSLVLS